MGAMTRRAFYVALACGFWLTFKQFEPAIFPVVEDFVVEKAEREGDNVRLYGSFNKVRDCEFIDLVAYSGKNHIAVVYGKHPQAPRVSRIVREQTYGPWLLIPYYPKIEIYAHHGCSTGVVTTKLFSGAIVL